MTTPLYNLTHIQQRYGARTVLKMPHLHIQAGEVLTLVGPSGAGKSTLLRLLALLEAPTQGNLSLNLNGHAVSHQTATIQDRRELVMVFQRPVLLSRSVRTNVAYGLRLRGERDVDARVNTVLERVALRHLAEVPSHTLSGGEMQRVALARALVLEPRILLLDEPTANLDPYNVRLIEKLVSEQQARYNTTIVLVTHNIFQAKRLASRVALLLDGELVEVAPVQAFFDAPQDPRTATFISGDLVY